VALLNTGSRAQPITVNFADTGLGGTAYVRDLWAQSTVDADPSVPGTQPFTGSYTVDVPAHGTALLRLSGTDAEPGNDLGGNASSSPAIVRTDDAHATAFVRGADGGLWQNTVDGTTWGRSWTPLGGPVHGQILGQPAAYLSTGGRLDVFVRGTDDRIWQRTYSGPGWGRWIDLGGNATDAPSVAWSSPTSWTLVARDRDGNLAYRGPTGGWTGLGSPSTGGGGTYGRPSAVVDPTGTVYVATRTPSDEIWLRTGTGTGWSDWTDLGGTVNGSPTLLATTGRVYLLAPGLDSRLWQRNFVDGAWGGWFLRGEFASGTFQGTVGVAAGANGSAWTVIRGQDNRVHQLVL
jgi:alpha-galactosidase